MADDITQNQIDLLNEAQSTRKDMSDEIVRQVDLLRRLGGEQKAQMGFASSLLKTEKDKMQYLKDELKIALKENDISQNQYKLELKRINNLAKANSQHKATEAHLKNITKLHQANVRAQEKEIEVMKAKGQNMRAFFSEQKRRAKDAWTNEDGSVNAGKGLGRTGAAAGQIAQNPRQMLDAMGPWGIVAGIIADVIDGARNATASLHAASAAGGSFEKSMNRAAVEGNMLAENIYQVALSGLDLKELTDIYAGLKKTGIEAFEAVGSQGNIMNKNTMAVFSFAKATGKSYEEITAQFDSMVRNFGVGTDHIDTEYNKLYSVLADVSEAGGEKLGALLDITMQLGNSFADMGVSILQVGKILGNVDKTMREMKFAAGAAEIQKVAGSLLGVTKASEGWLAFMGKMSGVQGGYASSLFSAQQRRGDMTMAAAGQFDMSKNFNQLRSAIMRPTAGISDPQNRQLMIERMGKQFGLDSKSTQVFQKMGAGGLSQADAIRDLKKIHEAAKKQQVNSKGMFDILRNLLMGFIAKPIMMIYSFMTNRWGSPEEQKEARELRKSMDEVSKRQKKETGGVTDVEALQALDSNAIGGEVKKSGLMMVHAGNTITPMAKTDPYKGGGFGAGGKGTINVSFNMQIDEKSLDKKFNEMKQMTLGAIKKQQKANFG